MLEPATFRLPIWSRLLAPGTDWSPLAGGAKPAAPKGVLRECGSPAGDAAAPGAMPRERGSPAGEATAGLKMA